MHAGVSSPARLVRGKLEGTSWRSMWQLPRGGLPGGSRHSPVLPTTRLLSLHTTSSIQNADTALTSEIPFFFFFFCLFSNTCSAQRKREGWGKGGMESLQRGAVPGTDFWALPWALTG